MNDRAGVAFRAAESSRWSPRPRPADQRGGGARATVTEEAESVVAARPPPPADRVRQHLACIGSGAHDATRSCWPPARPGRVGGARLPSLRDGWHTRCLHPDLAEDGDGELVERCCCDGLMIARRRRPLWTR